MDSLKRLAASAVVPVVVLDDAKDAVATAKALLAGGVDVMEITFRTAAAADSIKAVAESCPDMLVGAGTVITLEQCKKALEGEAFLRPHPRLPLSRGAGPKGLRGEPAAAEKAPLKGELSAARLTERLSQIWHDLSVSASPSHLP